MNENILFQYRCVIWSKIFDSRRVKLVSPALSFIKNMLIYTTIRDRDIIKDDTIKYAEKKKIELMSLFLLLHYVISS